MNKGFAGISGIYLIGIILLFGLGVGSAMIIGRNKINLQSMSTETPITTPISTPSATPKNTVQKTISPTKPSPTTSPSPQTRTITIEGFAYEDRSNDGLFNSDDPKLPNMHLLVSDSDNKWSYSTYTGPDGHFIVSHIFAGNIVIKPSCNENFCPKEGAKTFSSSVTNQMFAFRSASAPTSNNNGAIEGDLIIESDRPYKFYLLDKNNNYYSNIEWAGGHFKVQNLPNNQTYIIRISYGDESPGNTEVTLTPSSPEKKTVQIYVR